MSVLHFQRAKASEWMKTHLESQGEKVTDSDRMFDKLIRSFAGLGEGEVYDFVEMPDETAHRLTAKQSTLIKSRPVQSSELSDNEKTPVGGGLDLNVVDATYESEHLKITAIDGKQGYLFPPHWEIPDAIKLPAKKAKSDSIAGVYKSDVKKINVSQPDSSTCQSAAVAMALNTNDVYGIRSALTSRGVAGDPAVMSWYLNKELGDRHIFDDNASMSEMREWLRRGEYLITYGWFTGSGHVIGLDGVSIEKGSLAYKFDVADPWSDFDFASWSYNNPSVQFYNGYYSALGIYAACVRGQSVGHAKQVYASGSYDSNYKGAWVHRVKSN